MAIEAKWQERWEARGTNAPDLTRAAKPYYNLMMFPYPSAEGLHVGNVFAFIGADIHGRFRRLAGHDVFEPIGFDAFGIHSENYALKVNMHPEALIPRNIVRFRDQLRRIGLMVHWKHELSTTDPAYYKWTQWVFLQLFKAGHAYRKAGAVNWCPDCKTVLANEQVVDGFCERHPETPVTQRWLEQWFFAITRYVERLLDNLEKLDWSDSTRTLQANWIGRSDGAELVFVTPTGDRIPVFTTRPDTIFGATFLVLAPEHPLVDALTAAEQREVVTQYRRKVSEMDVVARRVGAREKTGVFTGGYARNPATGENVPVWIADYVLMDYGTGAIMAVPAHDERDYEFARLMRLPITQVVAGDQPLPFTSRQGTLTNSGAFDGMRCDESIGKISDWLAERGLGKRQVQFRLHDWCISRQRYWGPPIPIIYCDACGPVGVPEKDLPVLLPETEDFRPDDSGVSPLARIESWYRVPCPQCGAEGRRETDVSDTFLDSAWYFLRYPSTAFADVPFDRALTRQWLPVNSYIGGNEHAVLHLMYARYITMVLHDLGHLDFEEPFTRFRAHGMIVKEGAKMSKSRGNVVVPDQYLAKWGADTFRMYLMFLGPYQEGGDFRDEGIVGQRRFLDKVWDVVHATSMAGRASVPDRVVRKLHQTIRGVSEDVPELRYNTALAKLMEYVNALRKMEPGQKGHGIPASLVEPLVVMLAPFAPHFAEECWERLGHQATVFEARWPAFDAELAKEDQIELVVQVNGKVRARIAASAGLPEAQAIALARADEVVRKFIDTNEIRKIIFVQDRLVNLVV
ncbi:MAG: leucine--tRNA ligase [Gemmatimonadales bacterium]